MEIPYKLVAAMAGQERWFQMYHAMQLGLPVLRDRAIDLDTERGGKCGTDGFARLTIACYGPSLADTWETMKPPILAVSGAMRFLADRGVVPDYQVMMDPRADQIPFIDPPVDGVHYLIASCCNPKIWQILKGQKVTMWHSDSGEGTVDFLSRYEPGAQMVRGGSHVGLAALHVGGKLGYRHFEIHGMDGSFKDGHRHAGPHFGHTQQDRIGWDAGGKRYATSEIMANGAAEVVNAFRYYPMFGVFHGDGLTQALIREEGERGLESACCADEIEKAYKLRTSYAKVRVSLWQRLFAERPVGWAYEIHTLKQAAEARRARAEYNTGSLSEEAMLLLRGIAHERRPRIAIEVGTFVGASTSAIALEAGHVYTCDRSNDCFESTSKVTTHPRQSSTEMLARLADRGVVADMFFFDGRISPPDVPLILRMSHPGTCYVFDDYKGEEKGVINVHRLLPFLEDSHVMEHPFSSGTRLAALLPRDEVGAESQPQPLEAACA